LAEWTIAGRVPAGTSSAAVSEPVVCRFGLN